MRFTGGKVNVGPEEEYIADEHPLKCIGTDDVHLELIRESFPVYKLVYLCRRRSEIGRGDQKGRRPSSLYTRVAVTDRCAPACRRRCHCTDRNRCGSDWMLT